MSKRNETWRDRYRKCFVCGKKLPQALAEHAMRRFEVMACSVKCRNVETKRRFACCEAAEFLPCVCMYAFTCKVHGTRHIGTHD